MFPAIAPREATLVNNHTLSAVFQPLDGLVVSMMITPEGRIIHRHVMYRAENGAYETLASK